MVKKYKEKLSEDHPDTLLAMNNLACTYSALGRNEDALGLYETVVKKYREKQSEDHPDTLLAMNNLACTYSALGRNEDALGLYETLLKKRKKVLDYMAKDSLSIIQLNHDLIDLAVLAMETSFFAQ